MEDIWPQIVSMTRTEDVPATFAWTRHLKWQLADQPMKEQRSSLLKSRVEHCRVQSTSPTENSPALSVPNNKDFDEN